ncbi:IgGFc-binding protein-like [Saccostrea cucullata]|uniref:IgGFc-binding protein-like n=1 Tax=Saccostrea cuccullata TaxID=36930 RepID=UPI002ED61473
MAENKFEQRCEHEYCTMGDTNQYEVLTTNLNSNGDFEEHICRKAKRKNTSKICVKSLVIFVVLVLVIGCTTMTVLYLQERNNSRDEKDNAHKIEIGSKGETSGQNNKTAACPNEPFKEMNYTAAGKTGIQGRQFLVCFTVNHPKARYQTRTIYILSDGDFEFQIISKFSTQLLNEVVTPTINMKEISVTSAIAVSYFKIEEKGLLIEATKDVSVITIDNYIHSSDSTGILPIKSISNSYVISSSTIFNATIESSQFAISSPENGTTIKIYFRFYPDLPKKIDGVTYRNGSEFILVLNELQTYQIWHNVDMSGTLIKASSAVAVFSGSICLKIGFKNSSYSGAYSKLDEQLPPIDRLDKMYIVPPTYNRKGTFLKIISPFHTRLTYKIGNEQREKLLLPSGYFEIAFSDKDVVIIDSEKPVLVTSFATGSDYTGDPYMITVPGIRQYTDKYIVMVPENFKESYVAIIVEGKSLYNLILNETNIIYYLNDRKFYTTVTFWKMDFVVLVLPVKGGLLRVESTNNAAFGFIVYGHRNNDGHGFAGKAVLPDVCVPSN